MDARFGVITAVLAGFGRTIAEVGAVLAVGGNINGLKRVMTATIALETSKGNLELALALGIVLIAIEITVNAVILARLAHNPSPPAASGVKVLIATHDLMQARRLADDVLLFGDGKLLVREDATTFFNKTHEGAVADFLEGRL